MAAAATASSIRYAPEDPSLPKPWKGLVDGRTGYLYFWNPETNVTQYQRPSNLAPPPRSSSVPISSSLQVEQSSEGQHRDCSPEKEDDRYGRGTIGGSKLDVGLRRNQSLRGAPIQSHNVPNGIASVRHGGLSMRGYGSSNAAVSLFPDAYCQQHKITVISKKRKKVKIGDRPRGHGKGDANCCARRMTQPARAGSSKAVPFSLIVSDPELFDCPICLEPLTIPVFQCEDGHIVCSVCCGQLSVCPTCSLPVGYIRCRAIEKVLESVKVRCPNTKYGCNETMSYNLMSDHELTCQYMPCSCPLPDCNFIGTPVKLHQHVSVKHRNSVVSFTSNRVVSISLNVNHKFIVLLEEKNADLFILNNMSESRGNVISVTCIGQPGKKAVVYNLLARSGGSTYKFQSLTRTIQKKEEKVSDLEKDFLLPSDLFGYYGQLNLEVRIYSRK